MTPLHTGPGNSVLQRGIPAAVPGAGAPFPRTLGQLDHARLAGYREEANDLIRLDLDGELDTAVLGDGAYKVTWDEREQRVVVSAPDVQGLYAWSLGDDVRRVWRVASRYEVAPEQVEARAGCRAAPAVAPRARCASPRSGRPSASS